MILTYGSPHIIPQYYTSFHCPVHAVDPLIPRQPKVSFELHGQWPFFALGRCCHKLSENPAGKRFAWRCRVSGYAGTLRGFWVHMDFAQTLCRASNLGYSTSTKVTQSSQSHSKLGRLIAKQPWYLQGSFPSLKPFGTTPHINRNSG